MCSSLAYAWFTSITALLYRTSRHLRALASALTLARLPEELTENAWFIEAKNNRLFLERRWEEPTPSRLL
jgi:superfamily I DNA/RNA helicase